MPGQVMTTVVPTAVATSAEWRHWLDLLVPAITAPLAALFGVWLANKAAAARENTQRIAAAGQFARQLDHAASEAKRQREFNTRRDVYLSAAEAVSEGQHIVGNMLDLSIPDSDLRDGLKSEFGSLAKANVISTLETVRAISNYSMKLGDVVAIMWVERMKIRHFEQKRQEFLDAIKRNTEAQERWQTELQDYNIKTSQGMQLPKQYLDMIQVQFDFVTERRQKHLEGLVGVDGQKTKAFEQAFEVQIRQMRELQALLPAALTAARKEIEMELDASEVEGIFREIAIRGETAARGVMDQVKQFYSSL